VNRASDLINKWLDIAAVLRTSPNAEEHTASIALIEMCAEDLSSLAAPAHMAAWRAYAAAYVARGMPVIEAAKLADEMIEQERIRFGGAL
jgi:hypothetical protein